MRLTTELFDTLSRRLRPEDVAQIIVDDPAAAYTADEIQLLDKAAAGSLKRGLHYVTSMSQDFLSAGRL